MLDRKIRIAMWRKLAWVPALQHRSYRWAWYYAGALNKHADGSIGVYWWH